MPERRCHVSPVSERPDVSEIVIAYDVRDEVLTCLESVGQHAGDVSVELLVIDNGSSDGRVEAVGCAFRGRRS